MTPREWNEVTRATHEVVEVYDWALDPEMNDDFAKWQREINKPNEK